MKLTFQLPDELATHLGGDAAHSELERCAPGSFALEELTAGRKTLGLQRRPVESYAAALLEEAAHLPAASPPAVARNMVELFAPLRGLNLDFERDQDP